MPSVDLSSVKEKYDVVIVGAGIGGLTAGAYLAKYGLSVLIVDQHYVPGGFCTIFKREGFKFDIGVHYLGSIDTGSVIGRVIHDLNLSDSLDFIKLDPTDVIIFPDRRILFRSSFEETIHNLQKAFPSEAVAIERFCRLLNNNNFLAIYAACRSKTFRDLLNEFFINEELKSTFCVMLGNIGLPSTMVSALTAAVMYRDYVFRGGNYPRGSMQRFATALATRYRLEGGDLLLKKLVTRIEVKENQVVGVWMDDTFIACDHLISNCSARQTFLELIGRDRLPSDLAARLDSLIPSPSAFIVYFSLNGSLKDKDNLYSNNWYCSSYGIDEAYADCFRNKVNTEDFLFCAIPSLHDPSLARNGYECGHLIVLVPYMNHDYWVQNKQRIADKLIMVANRIVPGFSNRIHKYYSATPNTIIRYTRSDRAAIYGWASTPAQVGAVMPQQTPFSNLLLAGHWTTLESGQGGITMTAYSGRNAAKRIIKSLNRVA